MNTILPRAKTVTAKLAASIASDCRFATSEDLKNLLHQCSEEIIKTTGSERVAVLMVQIIASTVKDERLE